MTAGNVNGVLRAPGRIIIDPTDLSSPATNYGGKEVGLSNLCVLVSGGTGFRVMSELLGEPTDILEAGNEHVFSCFMRGWDDDGILKFRSLGHSIGSTSGHAVMAIPGATPGASALGRAVILLYVPLDLLRVPALLIYRGIPQWGDGAEIAFQRGEELGIPISLECVRDANNNIIKVGRLADLSLT